MSDRTHEHPKAPPIAIIGVSALLPGSQDVHGAWRDILAATDLLTDVPPTHWLIEDYYDSDPAAPDKTYGKRGGFLDPVPFDPLAFGIPPTLLEATDSAQLLALVVARQLLDDAWGGRFGAIDRDRIGCILGVTSGQELMNTMSNRLQRPVWAKALRERGMPEDEVQAICDDIADLYVPWQEGTFPGLLGNVIAGRVANRFDLGGTNCVTDAACASSLAAISMAADELALGRADVMLTGGVDTFNDVFMYMCFSKTPALSKTGDCRPFSAEGDGTMLGEGLAMFAMKRLEDAERDGDRVYAVLHAVGSSSDGRAKSIYAPVSAGQSRAIRRAYELAGFPRETVELIEAHGTGTVAGDAAEFGGLELAFEGVDGPGRPWCALGSIKSQIGHTKAAAGAAGMLKAVLALHHKILPPTAKIEAPNPKINLTTSPFYLNTQARPWVRDASHPRRAGVSSFGFGGSNFHAALEEYTGEHPAWRTRSWPAELFVFQADDPEALRAQAQETLDALADGDSFTRLARALAEAATTPGAYRLAVVAEDPERLRKKLVRALDMITSRPEQPIDSPDGVYYGATRLDDDAQVAFLFPGQGSQHVDMGADLAMHLDPARRVWDRAASMRFGDDGVAIHERVFPPPAFDDEVADAQSAALTATQWAQPALGVASAATAAVLGALGIQPAAVAGHSFGELTALWAAGACDLETLIGMARRRGELMAEAASRPGAMSALSASAARVQALLDEHQIQGVCVANHNAPRQVVISGEVAGVEAVEALCEGVGIVAHRLPVATAFHSPVVSDASAPFRAHLDQLNLAAPTLPVWANTTARPHADDPDTIRDALAAQIASPVRFVEQIEDMAASGVRVFIEVGPRGVLTRLARKILHERDDIHLIATDQRGRHGLLSLCHALGKLHALGVRLSLAALWSGVRPEVDPRTLPKPRLSVPISGTNHNKPYPRPEDVGHTKRPRQTAPRPTPAPSSAPAPTPRPAPSLVATAPPAAPIHSTHPTPAPSPRAPQPTGRAMSQDDPTSIPAPPQLAAPARPALREEAWLQAFQENQRQLVDAHARFQHAMSESHRAFMSAMEHTQDNLVSLLTGTPAAARPAPAPVTTLPAPAPVAYTPAPASRQITAPAPAAPAPVAPAMPAAPRNGSTAAPLFKREDQVTVQHPSLSVMSVQSGPMSRPDLHAVSPSKPAAPAATAAPAAGPALKAVLLEVVSEKTGYPSEMLELSMELEADLGIDSIKRVEILSAVQERLPSLPDVDASALGALSTLQQIVDHLDADSASTVLLPHVRAEEHSYRAVPTVPSSPAVPAASPAPAATTGAPSVETITSTLLDVVSEKTGYPSEMLELSMELEADLGIDSIKRVEILSAVQERLPSLPDVDAATLGTLSTLEQILKHMSDLGGAAPL